MLNRYARPPMAAIWSEEEKLRIWVEIECLVSEAQAELGLIPASAARAIRRRARVSAERIAVLEKRLRHDVIAFLADLASQIGEPARFVHRGLTSSDVLDTCLAVQLTRAADLLLAELSALLEALKRQALRHQWTLCLGRSHAMAAQPLTFGWKMAQAFAEFSRQKRRLQQARREIAVCVISGPVGTYSDFLPPAVEAKVAAALGLEVEPISTQIAPRDRHAVFFTTLAVLASSVERLAVEIRHLQRSEVNEAAEPFAAGQQGSSAMPHKRNPILSENITGLARLARAFAQPAMENVVLWHERDISHSSVERVMAPDACMVMDFALARLTGIIDNLEVYPRNMAANLAASRGQWASAALLLALTDAGVSRQQAYPLVQEAARRAALRGAHLLDEVRRQPAIAAKLDEATLKAVFDEKRSLRYIGAVFERLFPGAIWRKNAAALRES